MIAHISYSGNEQTVIEHIIGVANKATVKGKYIGLENLLYLTGLLHDMGKGTRIFEDYIRKAAEDSSSVRRGELDHSTAGGKYIYENFYKDTQIQKITAQLISIAITSHHGLYDCIDINGKNNFVRKMNKNEEIYYEEVLNNCKTTLKTYDLEELFKRSLNEAKEIFIKIKDITSDMNDNTCSFFLLSCLERLILSVLVDADWTDTSEFMNEQNVTCNTDESKLHEIWKNMQLYLDNRINELSYDNKVSLLRKSISDECYEFGKNGSGVYCLPIPTGGGKTLSGLRYAIEHSKINNKSRIIYVAPYLSILEQNANEYRKALGSGEYILEHHSNIILDEADSTYKYLRETWDSPIILTTMVQFLEVLFSGRMQSIRRMNQLANSVIIIDEIQSLPIKCVSIFNLMMNFLSRVCNATIVLCSATQPLLGQVDKNILYSQPINITKNIEQQFENFKRTKIINSMIQGGYNTEELSEFVLSKINNVDNCLIILNTKSAVKNLFSELSRKINEENIDVELVQLTTYMCAEHRNDVIKSLKEKLGNRRVICISTQLIEAGVDISFECVIRSLAGIDNIAQAAGRCNRNGEREIGYVYVINYKDENVSKLKDIKEAQRVTQKVFDKIESDLSYAQYDLLSPKMMNLYYEIYFYNRKNEMDYTIKESNTTILELLDMNPVGSKSYVERNGEDVPIIMKQAFDYAGQKFEVIDSNTIGLLVPYKNGKSYIDIIKNSRDFQEIKRQLRKMQRYTVNMYRNDLMIEKLKARNAIDDSALEGNILILREGFYDEVIGVSNEMEDLIM